MNEISPRVLEALVIGALISLPFKAIGLWRASKNDQKGWFAALLLVNSLGLLELIYLFYFSQPKSKD
jgi:methionyl-tRNA synthetase